MISDDQLVEWIEVDLRVVELAERLTAPGPKASAVSASELHEVAEFVLDAARTMQSLIAEIRQSRRESVELLTGIEQSLKENNPVLTYAHANDAALERAYENLRVDLQRLLDLRVDLQRLLDHGARGDTTPSKGEV